MKFRCALAFALMFASAVVSFPAQAGDHQGWKNTSDITEAALIGASLGIPAARGDWQGFRQAAFSDALGQGVALLGKAVVHEERPNHRDNNSFPSGHTTVAFAAATTLYRRYGWRYGFPAYAVATLTGVSRVAAREHHWWDAMAGAALGVGAGWLMTTPIDDHVVMVPWISKHGGGVAMVFTW